MLNTMSVRIVLTVGRNGMTTNARFTKVSENEKNICGRVCTLLDQLCSVGRLPDGTL